MTTDPEIRESLLFDHETLRPTLKMAHFVTAKSSQSTKLLDNCGSLGDFPLAENEQNAPVPTSARLTRESILPLQVGLSKLDFTSRQVSVMRGELTALMPVLGKTVKETDGLLVRVAREKAEVVEPKKVVVDAEVQQVGTFITWVCSALVFYI